MATANAISFELKIVFCTTRYSPRFPPARNKTGYLLRKCHCFVVHTGVAGKRSLSLNLTRIEIDLKLCINVTPAFV